MHLSAILQQILNEANILNTDIPLNGVSIKSFLAQYLKQIPANYRDTISKKLTKLIVNDDRWHQPVTQLPDGAPDWAVKAFQSGSPLTAFVPNPTLANAIDHITHYISAIDVASKKEDDPNEKAVADQEIRGLSKAENLDILIQQSNQYFARGSKKIVHTAEGTEHILTTGQYDWYKLVTLDAYQREGKALQNCIGSHYKPDNNNIIFVMKSSTNKETVVAIRVTSGNTITEVKGKNNKPPVARYMQSVADFINHEDYQLNGMADADIRAAGYAMYQGVLYSKSELIEKFTTNHVIPSPGKEKIVAVDIKNIPDDVKQLVVQDNSADTMYIIGDRLSLETKNKQLIHINGSSISQCLDEINQLIKIGLINSANDVTRDALRNMKLKIGDGSLYQMASADHLLTNDQITTHSGDTKTKTLNVIKDWLTYQKSKGYFENIKDVKVKTNGGSMNQGAHVALVDNDNYASFMNLTITKDGRVDVHTARFDSDSMRGDKFPSDWLTSANENKWIIPASIMLDYQLIGTPGNYHQFNADELLESDTNGVKLYDLSKLKRHERASGLIALLGYLKNDRYGAYQIGQQLRKEISDHPDMYDLEHTNNVQDEHIDSWVRKLFEGYPTRVFYVGEVGNGVAAYVVGNKITRVYTKSGVGLPGSNIHHPKILEQIGDALNTIIKQYNLTVDPKILAVDGLDLDQDNIIRSQASKDAKNIENRRGVANNEIKFKDGTIIKPMPARDAVDHAVYNTGSSSYKDVAHPSSEMYEIVNPSNDTLGTFLVKDGKMVNMWSDTQSLAKLKDNKSPEGVSNTLSGRFLPNSPSSRSDLLQYITAAAKKLGFEIKQTSKTIIKPKSKMHKVLDVLSKAADPMPRTKALVASGSNIQSLSGWDSAIAPADKQLVDSGFVDMTRKGNSYLLSITNRGRTALQHLDSGSSVNLTFKPQEFADEPTESNKDGEEATSNDPDEEDNKELPSEEPAPESKSSGTSSSSSKMGQAKKIWEQMVTNGTTPTRAEFIKILIDKLNMTKAGASTYYQTLKVKHLQSKGELAERFTFLSFLMLVD